MKKKTAFARYRAERKLTLDETAKRFSVDRTTILRWETDRTRIPIKRLHEISVVTGIPQSELRPDLAAIFGGGA